MTRSEGFGSDASDVEVAVDVNAAVLTIVGAKADDEVFYVFWARTQCLQDAGNMLEGSSGN